MRRDVVTIILFNKERKILLQLRDKEAPTNPSKWCFFGGGIEKGEDNVKAVLRETKEEINYNLNNPKLIYDGEHPDNGRIYVYAEEYDYKQKIELNEGKDFGWFSMGEIKEIDIIPYMKDILFNIQGLLFGIRKD